MTSELAGYLDEAITPIRIVLAQAGFRARKRTFNRRLENGIIHVVQVRMGRSDPPGTAEIPGFRRDWYGTFSVELGVFVPEVAKHLHYWQKPKSFPGEVDCCIRLDAIETRPDGRAGSWDIEEDASLYEAIAQLLDSHAMRFFARHADRGSIVAELRGGQVTGPGGAPRVVAAVILAEAGEPAEALRLLHEQDRLRGHAGHSEYLRELATRLQLAW